MPGGVGDDAPCFLPKAWPCESSFQPTLERSAAEAPAAEAPAASPAARLALGEGPPPFMTTYEPHLVEHPWMSEPYPRALVYPNVRPEWCSPSWHAKPVADAAFIPGGRSKTRVRPLLRALLRKLRQKVSGAWPAARVQMKPIEGDYVRVSVDRRSVPEPAHLALRAYLRNLQLDDRMLDRRVTFQRSEPDAGDRISALYDVRLRAT